MDETQQRLIVGKFGAPFGVHGWVKIHSATDPIKAILDYQPWYIKLNEAWKPLTLITYKIHNKGLIAQIEGYDNPETVSELKNLEIYVLKTTLPKLSDDEIYWADLEGMQVYNKTGVHLGKIDHLISTGSNDVMIIIGERRHLIPFIRNDVVININKEKQEVLVDWDENF